MSAHDQSHEELQRSAAVSRRRFLRTGSFAAAAFAVAPAATAAQDAFQLLGAEDAKASSIKKGTPYVRVLFNNPDGTPIDHTHFKTLHARDLANDPLPQGIAIADGRARIALANEPFQISCRIKVPGFGEVYCYADNEGKGYTKQGNVEFVVEAAKTRLARVRQAAEQNRSLSADPVFDKHLADAARPIPAKPGPAQIAAAYESLAHGLHAGERLVLNAARARIAKLAAPRRDFLFGCLGSGWQRGGEYERRLLAAFNFTTISWYTWKNEMPEAQRIDYARMDQAFEFALKHNIVPKGFGYVYLTPGATPEWFRAWPYDRVLPEYKRIVKQTMQRYSGRMPYVEVMNEAHDKANLFHLSHQQILELAREACKSAREGSPDVKRQINHCCLWAEYAKRSNPDGVRRWSPYRFVTDCIASGVEFECLGLQLYYPSQDLFEIERMLDRFRVFKRPIHITEISCNSAEGPDPASMRPKEITPGWHGPWSETMQADWLEAIYTLCYSKPEFEAVGWWDIADYGGHFWPHGGLLRKDFTPKESYLRLLQLQKNWGIAKA